jgi:hypothetical protein
MKKTAFWITRANGFWVSSPGAALYDHYFSTMGQMFEFANEMGWKLKHIG